MNIIDKESSEEESIDPKLPQHLKNSKRDYSKTESFHIGPQLPDHLTREKSYNRGPSLPPDIQPKGDNSSSDDDNDMIGPGSFGSIDSSSDDSLSMIFIPGGIAGPIISIPLGLPFLR
jgi:hypothetical protein